MNPSSLDHVALWVTDPDPLADFVCEHLGMHVIEKTDAFTLVGVDAKLGKLTLFAAEGPRERGALERIVLRVRELDSAIAGLPEQANVHRIEGGGAEPQAARGGQPGLVGMESGAGVDP